MGFPNNNKCFIIAELSANHNGDKELALKTIRAAAESGADAIKLQTYTPDSMTLDSEKDDFVIKQGTIWDGRRLHDLYQEAYTPWEWHKELFDEAKRLGLFCFSSPFDLKAVDLLEELSCPAYKIASFEITDIPLIRYVASKGKPMIISTGIAELEDIKLAIATCIEENNTDITILKCTSSYPAPLELANLKTILDIPERFGVEVGLSDHTMGSTAAVVAVSLGAKVIEKHFILDKNLGGPDASFSMEPHDFKQMVKQVREAEIALGEVSYELSEKTKKSRGFSRSLYIAEDIKKGEVLNEQNLRSVRPGFGLHPKYLPSLLGKTVNRDLEKGDPFQLDYVNESLSI